MKNYICIMLLGILGLTLQSCRDKDKSSSDEAVVVADTGETKSGKKEVKNKDCEDFLDEYEQWMDEFVDLMRKYKDNPIGLVSDPAYTTTMSEGITWATDWMQKPTTCIGSSYYQKRFDAIQEKSKKKMKELGLK